MVQAQGRMKLDVPDFKGIRVCVLLVLSSLVEKDKKFIVQEEERPPARTQPFLVDTVGENGRPSKSFTRPVPKSDCIMLSYLLLLII